MWFLIFVEDLPATNGMTVFLSVVVVLLLYLWKTQIEYLLVLSVCGLSFFP